MSDFRARGLHQPSRSIVLECHQRPRLLGKSLSGEISVKVSGGLPDLEERVQPLAVTRKRGMGEREEGRIVTRIYISTRYINSIHLLSPTTTFNPHFIL